MIKIYRKADLRIVSSVPEGVDPLKDFELNVGGNIVGYGFIEVPFLHYHLEQKNGEVVAVEDEPPTSEPEPSAPTIDEYLLELDFRLSTIELGL